MNLLNLERKKTENSKQYSYRVLKENIMSLRLVPGESISETEISEILKVSRTPVREAIVRLSEEKLVTVFPQKGSFVSKIDLKLVEEAIFLREICEENILERIIDDKENVQLIKELERNLEYQKIAFNFEENLYKIFNLDNEFHKYMYSYYGKPNVWKSIKRLSTHYDRLRLLDTLEKMNVEEILKQHSKIIEVLKNRKKEKIKKSISEHLINFENVIGLFKEKYPNYFLN